MVSKLGLTDLIFINAGEKINGTYYHDMLLTQKLLPAMHEICAVFFTFQQCNALLLLTEHETTSGNDRRQSCFHFTTSLAPNSTDLSTL